MTDLQNDDFFMGEALKQARLAFDQDEVPVGAVIVCGGRIIGRGYNLAETLKDATAHAEMQAFTAASSFLGGKYLSDCTLYVTLEPCCMCAGAAFWTQLGRLVYGASDINRGFLRVTPSLLHPKTEVVGGLMEDECRELIVTFFKQKR